MTGNFLTEMARDMRPLAAKALYSWACNGPLSDIGALILRKFGKVPVKVLATYEQVADKSFLLASSCQSLIQSPNLPVGDRFNQADGQGRIVYFPEIKAHLLSGFTINVYSHEMTNGSTLAISSYRKRQVGRVASNGVGFSYYDKNSIVCDPSSALEIEKGIFLGGDGAFNWYHFVIECLPKIYLLRKSGMDISDFFLILPIEAKKISNFHSILAPFTDGMKLLFYEKISRVTVKKLLVLDDISTIPYNMVPGCWPEPQDCNHHAGVMKDYCNFMRSYFVKDGDIKKSKKIFICRPSARRAYNQEEILKEATKRGFIPIHPDQYSVAEQAAIFSQASHVIGPSGAAWVNAIFSLPGIRGISWLPYEYRHLSCYSMLFGLLRHEIFFLQSKIKGKPRHTGDLYSLAYELPLADFRLALQKM